MQQVKLEFPSNNGPGDREKKNKKKKCFLSDQMIIDIITYILTHTLFKRQNRCILTLTHTHKHTHNLVYKNTINV